MWWYIQFDPYSSYILGRSIDYCNVLNLEQNCTVNVYQSYTRLLAWRINTVSNFGEMYNQNSLTELLRDDSIIGPGNNIMVMMEDSGLNYIFNIQLAVCMWLFHVWIMFFVYNQK
jgi:hypothetical protein